MLHPQDRKNAFARGYLEERIKTALFALQRGNCIYAKELLERAAEDVERDATRHVNEVTI